MSNVGSPGAFRVWAAIVVVSAVLMTTVDAVLLQAKRAFFTGGFLAVDYLSSLPAAVGFLFLSFLGDAAVIGVVAALAFTVGRTLRLTRTAAALLAAAVPLFCLGVADITSYQLVSHLGDAFDFSLMFDLTGRNPAELWAVSAKQLAWPAAGVVGIAVLGAITVRAVNRRTAQAGRADRKYPTRGVGIATLVLLVVGTVVTTAARVSSAEFDNGLKRKPSTRFLGAIVDALSDVDRDGFGLLRAPADPAPTDAGVYPYAVDLPGNGIDENGVGGDLPAGNAEYDEVTPPSTRWPQRPDVVLIVLESFRADAVGAKLAGKSVTPVLDSLAARGISVDAAYSHNGYTAQSRHHLMTGSLAGLRGSISLIDDFKAQGYQVGYFSGQDDSFGGAELGVGAERADTMFDARQAKQERYSTFSTPGSLAVPASTVLSRVRSFLGSRSAAAPLFLYVNFHDTHYPYSHGGVPPTLTKAPLDEADIIPSRREELRETYYNAAAYVDSSIGELLNAVQQATGRSPATVVISDHGESLYDDTFLGHGYALNDAQTRIPLIATGLGMEVATPFGQSDLRDVLVNALSAGRTAAAPVVREQAGKRVFQYLGTFERPRQIGFISAHERLVFDFRSGRVCRDEQPCVPVARLDPPNSAAFLDLVQKWESMVLARSSGR
jgi:hypothetical protein